MNWNQEELEQWALTQQQKEEDNEAVAAYRAQDASKIKELNMAVERMSKTVYAYKAELDREVTDTQAAQVQLDKAADDFAVLHKVCPLYSNPIISIAVGSCLCHRYCIYWTFLLCPLLYLAIKDITA
jgi:uncharacterized protein YeaC (DUF1315 family)